MSPATAPKRIVVLGDVHSDLDTARAFLRRHSIVDSAGSWCAPPGTTLVQVGDQIDGRSRVPGARRALHRHGAGTASDLAVFRFFSGLSTQASHAGGAVHSLLGNHEVMNFCGDFTYADIDECAACAAERAEVFRVGGELAREVAATRPTAVRVGDILFAHAGLTPGALAAAGSVEGVNRVARDFLNGTLAEGVAAPLLLGADGILTHRRYSPTAPALDEVDEALERAGCRMMVIGHHAHDPGVSVLGSLNQLVVVDPGMSRSVIGRGARGLLILPREGRMVRME